MPESLSLPKTASVKWGEATATVKRLPLGKFSELARILEELSSGPGKSLLEEQATFKTMMELLRTAPDKVSEMVALVSSVTKEQALEGDVEEIVDLLAEAFRLNNIVKLFGERIKKAMSPATE